MQYGTITVKIEGREDAVYPLEATSFTIGRGAENLVKIDDPSVARRQARIIFETGQVDLEDLGSETPVYVDDVQLATGARRHLASRCTIRMGAASCVLELHLDREVQQWALVAPIAATAETAQLRLTLPGVPSAAGRQIRVLIDVKNSGAVVDEFELAVLQVPAEWVRLSSPSVSLLPGGSAEVVVEITPPRSAEAVAGPHTFEVCVRPRVGRGEVRSSGSFTIEPFDEIALNLDQPAPEDEFGVTVENRGNRPVDITILVERLASGATLAVEPGSFTLAPGAVGRATLNGMADGIIPQAGLRIPFRVSVLRVSETLLAPRSGELVIP